MCKNQICYKKSNRYKLNELLKNSGFKAKELSLTAGFSGNYLSAVSSESRYLNRGDLTEAKYQELVKVVNLAVAAKRNSIALELSKVNIDDIKAEQKCMEHAYAKHYANGEPDDVSELLERMFTFFTDSNKEQPEKQEKQSQTLSTLIAVAFGSIFTIFLLITNQHFKGFF